MRQWETPKKMEQKIFSGRLIQTRKNETIVIVDAGVKNHEALFVFNNNKPKRIKNGTSIVDVGDVIATIESEKGLATFKTYLVKTITIYYQTGLALIYADNDMTLSMQR